MKTEGLPLCEALDLIEEDHQRIKSKGSKYVVGIQKGKYPISFPAVQDVEGIHLKHFEFWEGGHISLPVVFSEIEGRQESRDEDDSIGLFGLLKHNWELVK